MSAQPFDPVITESDDVDDAQAEADDSFRCRERYSAHQVPLAIDDIITSVLLVRGRRTRDEKGSVWRLEQWRLEWVRAFERWDRSGPLGMRGRSETASGSDSLAVRVSFLHVQRNLRERKWDSMSPISVRAAPIQSVRVDPCNGQTAILK